MSNPVFTSNNQMALAQLPWMSAFRTQPFGLILKKSALVKGEQIGAFNPFGQLVWCKKNEKVIVVE